MRPVTRWDQYAFDLCKLTASLSKDPSTKVGACILRPDHTIASIGFNGFPKRCYDSEHLYDDRKRKYSRIIHAEMNAILNAREVLEGYALYTWPYPPCDRCVPHVIQAGITVINYPKLSLVPERWRESVEDSILLALEADLITLEFDYE